MPENEEQQSSSDSDDDQDDPSPQPVKLPPNRRFPELHSAIAAAIASLGGAVAPKLNWSSPKDATWISRHPNTVKCTSPNDVYILLKSSSFISHDLDHAFDDTVPCSSSSSSSSSSSPSSHPAFTPVLVLRAFFSPLPSLEFRCFVKDRNLIAITQRDLHYYPFLHSLRPAILVRVRDLFFRLRLSFPDDSFVFDVYIPEADYNNNSDSESSDSSGSDSDYDEPGSSAAALRRSLKRLGRARLIDLNPWAPKTDSLLFDWQELLGVHVTKPAAAAVNGQQEPQVVRLRIRRPSGAEEGDEAVLSQDDGDSGEEDSDSDGYEEEYEPELRLIERDDPGAFNFGSAPYSAHKLPKDVVDASQAGEGGMQELAREWRRLEERGAGGR